MSDTPVQPEAWNAAGRTAALLFAIVVFAAIWEADSSRSRPEQVASEPLTPPALSPGDSAKAIDIGSRQVELSPQATVQLDQTLQRPRGLVRIRLELEPVDQNNGASKSQLVCEGQVDDLRQELLALLKQLDEPQKIVPASAVTSSKPKPGHRGFIFLSRRPEMASVTSPVSVNSPIPDSKGDTPGLLDSSVRIGVR